MPIILCEMLLHFVVALFYLEEESREREILDMKPRVTVAHTSAHQNARCVSCALKL